MLDLAHMRKIMRGLKGVFLRGGGITIDFNCSDVDLIWVSQVYL